MDGQSFLDFAPSPDLVPRCVERALLRGLQNPRVGRHPVATLDKHDVAWHQLARGHSPTRLVGR